jgi:uncharacterized protein (TIGR02117 family)
MLNACAAPVHGPGRAYPQDGPAVAVHLVVHEWHTGIAIRRADIPAGIWPESRDFPQAEYLEVGWGDRDFYQGREQGPWGMLRAALWPTPSVLHVAGVQGRLPQTFPASEIVQLTLPAEGFQALLRHVHDAFQRAGAAAAAPLGPGLYGDSRFYPARESFHLFRTCNVWTARALQAAGLPVRDAITKEGLMTQARALGKPISGPQR